MDHLSAELESLRKRVKELEASEIDLRKRLEILGLCESWYRQIIDDQTDFICRFLWDGTITFINRAFSNLVGKSPDGLVGTPFRDIIPAEDFPGLKSRLSTITPEAPVASFEHGLKIDGDMSWQQWTVRSIYDRRGKPVEYQAVGRDITARKKAEDLILNAKKFFEQMVEKRTNELEERTAQLAESEKRYRTIFQTTGSVMAILEEDMTVSLVNDRVEQYLGFSREEIEGRKWVEFIPEEEMERLLENDRLWKTHPPAALKSYETRLIHKDGPARDFFVTVDQIPGTKRRIVSLIDITERKRAEEELKERERELAVRTRNLEEMNSALNVLLKKFESDKQDLIENIKINIHEMVSPPMEKLKRSQLGEMQRYYVKALERNLQAIASPFMRNVRSKYPELSPKETQIINFIKEGRTTKEIAAILGITIKAVEFHRYNIRKKFRLTRKKSTLAAHLSRI